MATTVFLSPVYGAGGQIFNNSGVPLGGGKVYTYYSGTTVPALTFSDPAGTTANPNPIILDSAGRLPTQIWIPSGYTLRLAVTDSSGNTVGYAVDGATGINDNGGAAVMGSEWNQLPNGAEYVDSYTFNFFGDYTTYFQSGRQVRVIQDSGYVYSWVKSCTFSSGTGYSTVVLNGAVLNSTMTLVYVGFINSNPNSLPATVLTTPYKTLANNNIGIGADMGPLSAGGSNIAMGLASQNNMNLGSGNISIGTYSLVFCSSGNTNIAIGDNSGYIHTASDMIAVGSQCLYTAVASQTIAIGTRSGYNTSVVGTVTLTDGIYIGHHAKNASSTETNAVVIGSDAISNGSNTITLGNSSHTDTYLFGRIKIPQYTTAGAPSYVKGAIYFDTTLNKLRVGGASAWETVTSA